MKRSLAICCLFLLSLYSLANHIVGGEIFYDYLSNDQYRITLKVYRDCNVATGFDGTGGNTLPCYITIYDGTNSLVGVYDMGIPFVSSVPPAFSNPCIQPPTGTCIEEGVYMYTITLPPQTGGYTIVYQRCCRTAGVANLSSSVTEGSSYYTKIPGPEYATHNSSPRFNKFPPIYICNGVHFVFDHSATDPDGDRLVYSLSSPFTGLDACCASLNQPGVPPAGNGCVSPPAVCPTEAPPPPYGTVNFASPFSGAYPIASNPAFAIDPQTGKLAGTPTVIAQFVVGVSVQEFRNNVLINTHSRDFQFTVVVCTVQALSVVADQKQQCQGQVITFTNQSITNSPNPLYHWDFGDPNRSNDTSNLVNPTYTYADTGTYVITLITNPGRPCSDTLQKPVSVYPPLKVGYNDPPRQCFKNNSFNFATTGSVIPQTAYQWDFTSHATPSISTQKNPTGIHFLESGLFMVKIRGSQFSCRDSFIDSVRVVGRATATIGNLQNNLCDPAQISFTTNVKSDLPVRYYWHFSNGVTTNIVEPTQVFSPAGTYTATLIIETTEVCNDTFAISIPSIQVGSKPVASFNFTPKETSILEPYITIDNTCTDVLSSISFNFGDGLSSGQSNNLHAYSNYGTYTITEVVVNTFGCADTTKDVVKITPEYRFWVPNSFTPDGNLRNDDFKAVVMGASDYELYVFNRWGQQIFRTSSTEEGWNGTFKGRDVPEGIYTWKINLTNVLTNKKETHLGLVTLMRNE